MYKKNKFVDLSYIEKEMKKRFLNIEHGETIQIKLIFADMKYCHFMLLFNKRYITKFSVDKSCFAYGQLLDMIENKLIEYIRYVKTATL